jgi:hypothetical protein
MLTYLRMGYLRRYIRINALRRGVFGGSKPWLAVFVLGIIGRQVGKVTKRGEMPIVLSERLKPGEGLVITHLAPPRRRGGRRRTD